MNIGILQSAGIAGNIIEAALNHPDHQEIFTPVIYSKENQNDKNVGSDLKFGNIEAVVVAPGSATEFKFDGSMTVYADNGRRIACMTEAATTAEDGSVEPLTDDFMASRVQKAWTCVCRDFLVSSPRVALVTSDDAEPLATWERLEALADDLQAKGIGVFGPYKAEDYAAQSMFQHFDITLAVTEALATELKDTLTEDTRVRFLAGIPMVMTMTDYPASHDFDETDLEAPAQALRNAVYTAMEISRCRKEYDEAHHAPLPKLYHERRDDSEKVRFAVSKKKEQQ